MFGLRFKTAAIDTVLATFLRCSYRFFFFFQLNENQTHTQKIQNQTQRAPKYKITNP